MFKEFINECDADEWLEKNYGKFLSKIQDEIDEQDTLGHSLFCYTGNMSKDYNLILEFNDASLKEIEEIIDKYYHNPNSDRIEMEINKVLAKDAKKDIRRIYNAFSFNVVTDDIVLFHYVNNRYCRIPIVKNEVFSINHFISTTMIYGLRDIKRLMQEKNYDTVLKINVKKGTNCIPIGNNHKSRLKEYEIILKPKTSFKINKIKKKIFGQVKTIVECEIKI